MIYALFFYLRIQYEYDNRYSRTKDNYMRTRACLSTSKYNIILNATDDRFFFK